MVDSIVNCEDPQAADVLLLLAPYDYSSSFGKGADQGPKAILACLHRQIEFYERVSKTVPVEAVKIAAVAAEELHEHSPEEMVAALQAYYRAYPQAFIFMLGGEHSVTNAPLRHFAARAEAVTIVQIDAHADLRQDDSDYSDEPAGEYAHCSVMRRAHDLGYKLVQVGIRAYSAEEHALFKDERIRVFEWDGRPPAAAEIVAAIRTEEVYLTIDVDGLDPAVMPATGTPVPGGLSWYYTLSLLEELCRKKRLIGADIVEVAPRAHDGLTEYSAAQLCYTIIGCRQATRNTSG